MSLRVRRPMSRLLAAALAAGCLAAWGVAAGAAPPESTGADTSARAAADSLPPDSTASDSSAIERAAAQLSATAESAAPETLRSEPAVSVPVFLGGRTVFRVRAGRDGLGPQERAAAIRARLSAAVANRSLPADSVRLVSTPDGIEVRLASQFLWLISPAEVEGLSATELAAQISELPGQVRAGIEKERAGRRPLGILISLAIALGITIVAWIVVRLLLAANRRWRAWMVAALPRYLHGIRFKKFEVMTQAQLTGAVGGILGRLDVPVGLLLFYVYVTLVFSLFPWTQGWSYQLFNFAASHILQGLRSAAAAMPGLFVVAITIVVFQWLTTLSGRFFDAIESGTLSFGNFHPELARPSKRLVRIVLWITAAIVAYPYIPGAQSKAVQGVSLLVGVMVSLGSTGFVGNAIAGIVLTYSRSFSIGDRVRIGDNVGDITNLGFFATKMRTIRNEEITIPNGLVSTTAIVNYTRLAQEHGLILHTEVTIGYDVDWRKVHELLVEAAGRVEGIEKEPRPWVNQRGLGDFNVAYELNCITRLSHPQLRLYSELHQEIQDAFARAGVEILSPSYHALRDAHAMVLPQEPAGPRPGPGAFRVTGGASS